MHFLVLPFRNTSQEMELISLTAKGTILCHCWRCVNFRVTVRAMYMFPAENYFWNVCSFLPFNFKFNNSLTMIPSNVIISKMNHTFLGNFLPKEEAVNIHFAFLASG